MPRRWMKGVVAILLLLASAAWADPRVEARRHFKRGMALIAEGRHAEGIGELLDAYAVRPHPNVLFNVARAWEAAGRPADAVTYYRRYLEADPPDAETVRAVLARLEPLAPKPGPPGPAPAPPAPAPPAPAEATEARLLALAERLERAVEQAEARLAVPPTAPPTTPAPAAPPRPTEADFGVPYEETVVAASRRAQSSLDAPNAVTVITGEEIRASGLVSLPDILRRVPGAEVMSLGLASANVSFRGFNQRIANKVLLLIDGRAEYQDFLGLTLWPVIPIGLEEIDRVEVIRGPGSALYGANAMLGVVNVITRAPGTGPRAEARGFAGNGALAGGSFVASGGERLTYRASVGYQQGDKYSRDFADGRPDVGSTAEDSDLGLRSARASLTTFYAFDRAASVSVSGGVNQLATEIYGIGLLRNFWLDGAAGFVKADATLGPVRLRAFWNHSHWEAAPQYEPLGQRSLRTRVDGNVFDAEALFQQEFSLLGTHVLAAGLSGRVKRVHWDYLGPLQQELHAAAFVQDEWRPLAPLSLVASYRVDRHPLLDGGQPGYAQSPRLSAVWRPLESHAVRASGATAFRQPTFLESYMDIRTPVPGVPGASVLTQGSRALRPERLLSFELGYRGEVAQWGLAWDVAAYWNVVSDLIVLSAVTPVPPEDAFDPATASFLLGRSLFVNDPGTYTARGGELGLTWNALPGLDLRASAAVQQLVPASADGPCGPCTQAPAVKLNGGVVYRSKFNLDLSADLSFVSATTWVEREPSAVDPTQVVNLQNPLGAFAVVNARVAWRLLGDRLTVAVVGSQLGPTHQEHPFGNQVSRRVFAHLTVQP